MTEDQTFVEMNFIEDGKEYFLLGKALLDEDADSVGVEFRLNSSEYGAIAHITVMGKITNPLEIVTVYLFHVAAHFGFCVGVKLIDAGGTMCFESYKESKAEVEQVSVKARCRDVYRRLTGRRADALKHAKSALKKCALEAPLAAAILPSG